MRDTRFLFRPVFPHVRRRSPVIEIYRKKSKSIDKSSLVIWVDTCCDNWNDPWEEDDTIKECPNFTSGLHVYFIENRFYVLDIGTELRLLTNDSIMLKFEFNFYNAFFRNKLIISYLNMNGT